MNKFLVANTRLIHGKSSFTGSLLVEGDKIAAVFADPESGSAKQADLENAGSPAEELAVRHAARLVDGRGCFLLPGGIDPHVHFSLPVNNTFSADDFLSGTRAALAGGTTSVIDFITPQAEQSLGEAAELRFLEAEAAACDYGLHASIVGGMKDPFRELASCRERYGLRSLKLYMAYLETIGLEDRSLLRAMETAAAEDMLVLAHCEDGALVSSLQNRLANSGNLSPAAHPLSRPPEIEEDAIRRALLFAEKSGAAIYIVHISTRGGIEAIRQAREKGQHVYAETCPHYLIHDERVYRAPFAESSPFVLSPPLRSGEHQTALWKALESGHFTTLATDHCPFRKDQKAAGADDFRKIPNGAPGLQYRLSLLYTYGVLQGRINLSEWVALVSENAARTFGLYPRKGALLPGSDADLVLWDPEAVWTVRAADDYHNCDTGIYDGLRLQGRPKQVWLRGKSVFDVNNQPQLVSDRGQGQYLFA